MTALPASIFKAYDIRGIVGQTLTPDIVRRIGQAIGTRALEKGQTTLVVGRDGRLSGPELAAALSAGLNQAGVDVIDIGAVPTPVTYFAAHHLGCQSAVSVTGSHNPPDYNGLKIVLAGDTLAQDGIRSLHPLAESGPLAEGRGTTRQADVLPAYLDRIVGDIHLARPLRVAIDCGNGVAGAVAPDLFRRLGCTVIPLFCEVDGRFPHHHPDPSRPENLVDLQKVLARGEADIGLAFDGDGDRLGVVTPSGQIIYPDRQLMLFAADVLSRQPGSPIIYDVKCSRLLAPWIRQHGGEPLIWNTGHALIKQKLKASGAPLAGEMSGHIFFKERWYGFDDGLYAGARLLEILARQADPGALLEALPQAFSTPEINVKMAEGEPFTLIARLQAEGDFPDAIDRLTLDGLRIEYADGFGLARPSNTTPVITLRFEGDTPAALARIQADFRRALLALNPALRLPF